MKKRVLLLACTVALMAACTEENVPETTNTNEQMTLHRIEKFSPSQAAYTTGVSGSTKEVKYYESNKVVADTTFDASGNVTTWVMHSYTTDTHTETVFYPESGPFTQSVSLYDNTGRIIQKTGEIFSGGQSVGNSTGTFVYNNDGSITGNAIDPGTGEVMSQYSINYETNESGYITSINYSPSITGAIVFDNDKPLESSTDYGNGVGETVGFTYYNVPLPSNMLKSVAETNNSILEQGFETEIAENCNYYLQSYVGYVTFDKTFNESGYVTYCKAMGEMHEEVYDSESFYYYNE